MEVNFSEKEVKNTIYRLGFDTVEYKEIKQGRRDFISIIIYKKEGVTSGDCTKIYKALMPKFIENRIDRDIHLEISSPGINRIIKSKHEFLIFKGKEIKYILKDSTEWISGKIESADDLKIIIKMNNDQHEYDVEDIVKARLSS